MVSNYEIRYVNLDNGERLAYREVGQGENIILFVHGNMSSSLHFAPLLEGLPEDFKAYAVDLRGFGESSYSTPIDSLKDFSDDLYQFVCKLGLKHFAMVGWSTGGGVCMQFAVDYPGYADRIIMFESVSYTGYPMFRKGSDGQELIGQRYETREEMAADPVQVAPAAAAMENKDFAFMNALWDAAIYTNKKPSAEDNEIYIRESLKQRNLVDVDWALATFNMSDAHNGQVQGTGLIDKLDIPVLSFWGSKDIVVTEKMVRETVDAIGDNATMIVLEASGHSPFVDCPGLLLEHITGFCRQE